MFLDRIVIHKQEELEYRKRGVSFSDLKERAHDSIPRRDFLQALKQQGRNSTSIIAELKKASPSQGVIRNDFDPVTIGKIYHEEGAVAISVLTESRFFHGDLRYLSLVRKHTDIPLLCKDFIIDPYQACEAAIYGADAFLLIAALLTQSQIEEFLFLGEELSMSALVEVHSEDELEKVLQTPAQIIGINNRDLRTFKIDIDTTLTLIKSIPKEKTVVSESGIRSRTQIVQLEDAGVHAFLIGEALMREKDVGEKLRELRGEAQ